MEAMPSPTGLVPLAFSCSASLAGCRSLFAFLSTSLVDGVVIRRRSALVSVGVLSRLCLCSAHDSAPVSALLLSHLSLGYASRSSLAPSTHSLLCTPHGAPNCLSLTHSLLSLCVSLGSSLALCASLLGRLSPPTYEPLYM